MTTLRDHVHAAIAATPIPDRLREKDAIVLERIAYGGGATNWYYCTNPEGLLAIEAALRGGSVVTFCFDDRFVWSEDLAAVEQAANRILESEGCCLVGALCTDGYRLDAQVVLDRIDIEQTIAELTPRGRLVYGGFPARDNDGVAAVTLQLPDADGVVRPHPH